MLGRPGSRLLLLATVIAFAIPATALAQVTDHAQCGTVLPECSTLRTNCCTRDFESSTAQKAVVIPLDRCHQQIANGGANGAPTATTAPDWCANSPGTSAKAMNRAYGLVYRLMQNGIPVYWIVNPTKGAAVRLVNDSNTSPATTPDARTKDVDFWIVSATGTPPAPSSALTAVTGTAPVDLLSLTNAGTASATLTPSTTYAYSRNEFPIRGGAFLIAPEDRAAFDAFHKTQLGRTCGTSGQDCYDFRDVWMYEIDPSAKFVWQDYTQPLSGGKYVELENQLPVAMRIDYEPPMVAAVDGNLLRSFLAEANLDDLDSGATCTGASLFSSKRVGCLMAESDIQAGELKTNGFNQLWLDVNATASCTATNAKVREFLTAIVDPDPSVAFTAGNAIFFNAAISTFAEGCVGDKGFLGSTTGLAYSNGAINETSTNPLIVRYPSNLFAQYGDLEMNFSAGAVTHWNRVTGTTNLYNPAYDTGPLTLRRLMTYENIGGSDCANHKDSHVVGAMSAAGCDDTAVNTTTADIADVFAYGRYLNNSQNGLIFYSPGNNLTPAGQQAQLRMVLSSLVALPPFVVDQTFTNLEVTRADPIVANVGAGGVTRAIVQGTYEYKYDVGFDGVQRTVPRNTPAVFVPADIQSFTFPALKGHLRATATSSIGIAAESLSDGSSADIVFDAGDSTTIPAVSFTACSFPASGSCRNVWTTTEPGYLATDSTKYRVIVSDTNTTVGSLMLPDSGTVTFSAADRQAFIQRVMQGWDPELDGTYVAQLGGIDRSTVAIVGVSPSYASRPTVGYVGSTDGMLHAICMNDVAPCTPGKELWAYIPRVNLGGLRYNSARIDSSPRVMDVRANLYGTGTSIYTVLLFQAGARADTEDQTPAIYALDISNPADPRVLWEHTTWDSSGNASAQKFSPTLAACSTQVSCGRQTYTGDAGDIPQVTDPDSRGAYALGEGITLAAGQATNAGVTTNIVIAQTNNGGTGAPANVITALDIATGKRLWQRVNLLNNFIAPRVAATIDVPSTAIPPGVVPFDRNRDLANGGMTDIVAGDLYGNLWVIDPVTGRSKTCGDGSCTDGTVDEVPIFQFTDDYHPIARPAIYYDGRPFAVFGTGGYTDYSTTPPWGDTASPAVTRQWVVAVDLTTTAGLPLRETGAATPEVPIKIALDNKGRVWSQPRIIGNEIFVLSDLTNVNAATFGSPVDVDGNGTSPDNTGFVTAFDLATDTDISSLFEQTRTGASALINDATVIFSSSGSKRQRLSAAGGGSERSATSRTGERTTAPRQVTETLRKLWLRTE